MGNQTSLENALNKIGCDVTISSQIEEFNNCDCLFLPGVGNFSGQLNVFISLICLSL